MDGSILTEWRVLGKILIFPFRLERFASSNLSFYSSSYDDVLVL